MPFPPDRDNPAGGSASVRTRRIREFAREVLGYAEFRPGQERAMQAVVGGRDTLAVLPSGAGKTAVYQVAGQLLDGPVVVVSPLIALQRDQVERLTELAEDAGDAGRAAQLNSSLPAADQSSNQRIPCCESAGTLTAVRRRCESQCFVADRSVRGAIP